MTRHETNIAGRQLTWAQSGSGAPILLLHAFPLHAEMWAPQHAAVPAGWQLITPDLRGFGRSTDAGARSVDDHADDVLALMRHLGLERAVIGGLSIGGYVAFALHRRASQRFRALILADTRAEADTEAAKQARVTTQQLAREKGPAAIADTMVPKLLGQTSRSTDELPSRVRSVIVANRAEAMIDALEALKTRPDSTSTLAQIACPTLVIVGAEDELTPVAVSETLHRGIARSSLVVVLGAGHLSNLEQPSAFNDSLRGFLASV